MRLLDLFGILLHWFVGLLGVLGCLFGFAALPGLLGVGAPENVLVVLFDIPLSKDILDAFSFPWPMVILAGGVFLYAWICFLFLFSTHIVITSLARAVDHENDGSAAAWTTVLSMGLLLTILFVVLLYGITMNQQTMAVGCLILAITSYLFAANYSESDEGEPHVISYQ